MDLPLYATSVPTSPDDVFWLLLWNWMCLSSLEGSTTVLASKGSKTFDTHFLCVKYRGHDCDFES